MRQSLTAKIAGALRHTLIRLDILATDEEADRLDAIDRDLRRAASGARPAVTVSSGPQTPALERSGAPVEVAPLQPLISGSSELPPQEGLPATT